MTFRLTVATLIDGTVHPPGTAIADTTATEGEILSLTSIGRVTYCEALEASELESDNDDDHAAASVTPPAAKPRRPSRAKPKVVGV